MKQINLTPEELSLLRDYYKTSPVVLIRNKALSIIMKNEGFSTLQIKSCLDRSVYTINGWIRNFHKIRMGSIFSGHVDNENASKLTKEQKNKIKNDLVLPPSEYGIPKEFWNVPSLRSYIKAEFGVTYESNQSYHYLLKFCEFSFKYPDTFSINRDETAIKARMKEIRKEIKQYLKNPEWEVFAADEVRMVLEAITRRAWLRKGKRTILKVNQTNEYQSYFGALNQKTFQCHTFELSWQNQEEIIPAVKN
jgi:transposase